MLTCSLYYHVNIMIDIIYIYICSSKETDSVITQFINLVILTDVLAQYNSLTESLWSIKAFGISCIETKSTVHAKFHQFIECSLVFLQVTSNDQKNSSSKT